MGDVREIEVRMERDVDGMVATIVVNGRPICLIVSLGADCDKDTLGVIRMVMNLLSEKVGQSEQ